MSLHIIQISSSLLSAVCSAANADFIDFGLPDGVWKKKSISIEKLEAHGSLQLFTWFSIWLNFKGKILADSFFLLFEKFY
jgi:exosome complex RNA-binding protein Rrp42 (RNase PH superfamily)